MRLLGLSALVLACSCGDDSLTRPADLPITTYTANQEFTMTLVMSRCRQACETYSDSECDVSIEQDDRTIKISPKVSVERNDSIDCNENCSGAAVLAHCEVGPLDAGTWTVEATDGLFSRTIELR